MIFLANVRYKDRANVRYEDILINRSFEITTIDALTFVTALLSFLVALAVIFQTPGLATLASFLLTLLLDRLSLDHIVTVCALTVHATYVPMTEALAVSGLTF